MSSSPSSSAVKRACDACHKRKVKCIGDGTKPCKNCAASGLSCTYNAIPQKKGPKGSRAKIISELRETQRLATPKIAFQDAPSSPAYSRNPGLLPNELIDTCVAFFFDQLYPTQPILERGNVASAVARMYDDVEAYVFVVSLCAYMCIQPNLELPRETLVSLNIQSQPATSLGQDLLREAIHARKSINWMENPAVSSVVTSFFFFGSFFCLDKHNLAWFHLREATTIAQLVGMQEEQHYKALNPTESARRRRLYWLLFVTERAYALQQHRPLSLHATISLPSVDEDPTETVQLNGFIHLATLFRPFDDTFVGLWNKAKNGVPTTTWLAQLQQELSEALPVYLDSTESQAVDIRLSQSWLKTMVWQLSISHGALSSLATDNAMSLKYPIEVSRELLAAANQFSQRSMEVHGIGLVEKLFDIACTLTDVISCVPYEQHTFEFGPRDYLSQMIQLISKLRGGQQRYMPLLMSKVGETLPNAPYGMSLVPESAGSRASEGPVSESASIRSTPFGTPPLSAVSSQGTAFSNMPGLGLGLSPMAAHSNLISTSMDRYSDAVVSTAMNTFQSPSAYQPPRGLSKFGPNG